MKDLAVSGKGMLKVVSMQPENEIDSPNILTYAESIKGIPIDFEKFLEGKLEGEKVDIHDNEGGLPFFFKVGREEPVPIEFQEYGKIMINFTRWSC